MQFIINYSDYNDDIEQLANAISAEGVNVKELRTIVIMAAPTELKPLRSFFVDASLPKALNDMLGSDFIKAFRSKKDMIENYDGSQIGLDGEIIAIRKDGKYVNFDISEWGMISTN